MELAVLPLILHSFPLCIDVYKGLLLSSSPNSVILYSNIGSSKIYSVL